MGISRFVVRANANRTAKVDVEVDIEVNQSLNAPPQRSMLAENYQRLVVLIALVLVCPLLSSCVPISALMPTPTQPVVKIGLLAPFEGLHRRNGYAALAAMRLAIDEYQQSYGSDAAKIIPLALHLETTDLQTGIAERTVAKLLADPEVGAVVGPYDPALVVAVEPSLVGRALPWFLPLIPNQATVQRQQIAAAQELTVQWLEPLLAEVAAQAAQQGATRLMVAGWSGAWFSPVKIDIETMALPLYFMPVNAMAEAPVASGAFSSGDALFWLGTPEAAAAFFAAHELSDRQPVSLWFGPAGDDPLLGELILSEFTFDSNEIFWVTWLDNAYFAANALETSDPKPEATDSTSSTPLAPFHSLTPTAYLTYRATQAAIASLNPIYMPPPAQWRVVAFARQSDGTSRRVDGVKE